MVVRRTKEQIKAGFPHDLAKKGVDFKEWLKKQKQEPEKKTSKVVRRTKKQIEAGFPLKLALKGYSFEKWLKEQEEQKEQKEQKVKEPGDSYRENKIKIKPPPEPKDR